MDLLKTLLVYMMLVLGSATEAGPAATPPPALPTATPRVFVIATPYTHVTPAPTAVPTAVPTLAPTAVPTAYTTLYVGDRGEDVRKLQRRLAELGYLTDKIDGVFGQNTKRAVERFQYYNDLSVDGIAGSATQRALFESRNVVIAPPDITFGPTASPTPLTGVTVPVYYVDQNGLLLKRVDMVCYGSSIIYANDGNAGAGYTLISPSTVSVTVRNGVASPASVTFRYQKASIPTEAPATVPVPVYYMTNTGVILHQTTANLPRNAVSYVPVNAGLVPDNYQLTSSASVAVTVNYAGTASPASVIFTFRNVTPTPAPETRQAQIPVRYVNENGFLLNETVVTVAYGTTVPVYASSVLVGGSYRLVSQNPVRVTVNNYGTATPSVVIFTYTYEPPTAIPTAVPTPRPTAVPTPIPTVIPTPIPTAVPTAVPTAEPTPEPTAEPTSEPTAEPTPKPTVEPTPEPTVEPTTEPTEEPTPEPTEEPTPEPTEEPTPEPTEEPTPEPTEEPTPEPTAEPTQPPQPAPIRGGGTVYYGSAASSVDWYRNQSGGIIISLHDLARAVGWTYAGPGTWTILGHQVEVYYADGEVYTLTVDGASRTDGALVWRNDLLVGERFLNALNLLVHIQDDTVFLEFI